jgi:hypothetical protein
VVFLLMLSKHHQSHAHFPLYRMSWQRPGNLYQRNADQASTTDPANPKTDAHGTDQQRLFQLIRSIWTKNDMTSNLTRMTKLTNPKDQTTRAELWYWDLYLKHLQSITTEDHQFRMQTRNHPAHSPKYGRTSSPDWTMTDFPEQRQWVYTTGTASVEDSPMEGPDSRLLRIVNGRVVGKARQTQPHEANGEQKKRRRQGKEVEEIPLWNWKSRHLPHQH